MFDPETPMFDSEMPSFDQHGRFDVSQLAMWQAFTKPVAHFQIKARFHPGRNERP